MKFVIYNINYGKVLCERRSPVVNVTNLLISFGVLAFTEVLAVQL